MTFCLAEEGAQGLHMFGHREMYLPMTTESSFVWEGNPMHEGNTARKVAKSDSSNHRCSTLLCGIPNAITMASARIADGGIGGTELSACALRIWF